LSSIQTPREKKIASYMRDRRTLGFDNPHGARIAIPRNKRRVNKVNRRAVSSVLAQLDDIELVEDLADEIGKRRPKRWRKVPDVPLAVKLADRSELARSLERRLP